MVIIRLYKDVGKTVSDFTLFSIKQSMIIIPTLFLPRVDRLVSKPAAINANPLLPFPLLMDVFLSELILVFSHKTENNKITVKKQKGEFYICMRFKSSLIMLRS